MFLLRNSESHNRGIGGVSFFCIFNLASMVFSFGRKERYFMLSEASKKRTASRSFGEEVVGCNVKVWWPLDQMFYKGKIAYFDCVKRKHRVQYDDGDIELLDLTKERWQILGNDNLSTEQEQQEIGAAHASTTMLNDRGRKLSYLPKRKKEQQDIVAAPSASTGTLNDRGGKSSRLQKRKKEQQEIVAARTASTKTLTDRGEKSSRLLKRKKIKGATKNEDKKGKTEARSSKGNLESAEDSSKKSN